MQPPAMATIPLQPAAQDCVSASDLVRRFGEWQERALTRPVFVMRRGRPALVLTSFDLMRRLCSRELPEAGNHRPVYLDSLREPVLRIGAQGRVLDCNHAAQLAFASAGSPPPAKLAQLLPVGTAHFIDDLACRAVESGAIQRGEIALGKRHYAITLLPDGHEAVLIADDISDAVTEAREKSCSASMAAAIEAHPLAAIVHVNLRGYIDDPSSLVRLCGIDPGVLAAIRFVMLVDIGSRAALEEAVEAAIEHRETLVVPAILPRNRVDPLTVAISLAPRISGSQCVGVSALIVPAATG